MLGRLISFLFNRCRSSKKSAPPPPERRRPAAPAIEPMAVPSERGILVDMLYDGCDDGGSITVNIPEQRRQWEELLPRKNSGSAEELRRAQAVEEEACARRRREEEAAARVATLQEQLAEERRLRQKKEAFAREVCEALQAKEEALRRRGAPAHLCLSPASPLRLQSSLLFVCAPAAPLSPSVNIPNAAA